MKEELNGLIAAPYSPLKIDGSLNPEAVKSYADLLIRNNVTGAFICGSSGEGISLQVEERKILAEEWIKHSGGKLKIIVHIGATSILDSQALAKHASETGADAIAAVDPIYFLKPWMVDLVDYYREMVKTANELPFYSYYIPGLTHYQTDYTEFCERAINEIPGFAGVKYTNNNLWEYAQLLHKFGDKIDVLFGADELLLNALASGALGAVGSTYNFMPSIYHNVIDNFRNGNLDKAREQQVLAQNIISLMPKYKGSVVFGKAVMNLIGIDCGPNRMPLTTLNSVEMNELRKDLASLGFFDHCAI